MICHSFTKDCNQKVPAHSYEKEFRSRTSEGMIAASLPVTRIPRFYIKPDSSTQAKMPNSGSSSHCLNNHFLKRLPGLRFRSANCEASSFPNCLPGVFPGMVRTRQRYGKEFNNNRRARFWLRIKVDFSNVFNYN
jgi:hypothetical protein